MTDLFFSLPSFDWIFECFENWIIRFEDSCGVYYPFQKERNIPVECNSDESHTPGKIKHIWGVFPGEQHIFGVLSRIYVDNHYGVV